MKTQVYEKTNKFQTYSNFSGLNVMRPDITLETGEDQALVYLHNAHIDSYGQIRNDPPYSARDEITYPIRHLRFYSLEEACWVERRGNGLWFNSENGITSPEPIYLGDVQISSCLFNKRVQLFSPNQEVYIFDGFTIRRNQSRALDEYRPSFGVAIQRRLVVAGFIGQDTLVMLSRVDDETVFPPDENDTDSVLAAAYIDITNQLTKADRVTGLAAFEQNKLAIFTTSKILIYIIDPDYTRIAIDDNVNVNVGTVSHNSIARVGDDLLFCSNHGVHSLKRSRQNGLTIDNQILSQEVKDLYLDYLSRVDNQSHINAAYDEKTGQYHIYFPINDNLVERLTLTIPTMAEDVQMRWSTGNALAARCGDTSNGRLVVGTSGGLFNVHSDYRDGEIFPDFEVHSPMLWVGNMQDTKIIEDMLIQITGEFELNMTIENEKGNQLMNLRLESGQFQELRYPIRDALTDFMYHINAKVRGIRLIIKGKSKSKVLISGFGFSRGDSK